MEEWKDRKIRKYSDNLYEVEKLMDKKVADKNAGNLSASSYDSS